MKRIFSIIILPTGTIAFWGTLVPRSLTVDHTFNRMPDVCEGFKTLDQMLSIKVCLSLSSPSLVALLMV